MKLDILEPILGLKSTNWMMSPNEMLVVIGILELLKPPSVLEIGHAQGGCTKWISHFAEEVITVDKDPYVIESSKRFFNVTPMNVLSQNAFRTFNEIGKKFPLCILDGDHSADGACQDLKAAIKISDIIILHDTSNPQCRAGYYDAVRDKDLYYDLDLVEGHIQDDGLWGGLGIVLTKYPSSTEYKLTPKRSTFPLLAKAYKAGARKRQVLLGLRRINYYISRLRGKISRTISKILS